MIIDVVYMKKIIITFVFLFSGITNAAWFGMVNDKTHEQIEEEKIEAQKKITICVKNIAIELEKEKNILKKYYFLQNSVAEKNVLKQYNKIEVLPLPNRLFDAESLIEYMYRVMSEINLAKKLFSENKITQEVFIKKINSLIFSWTVPYEILATENIYNHSLMKGAKVLYENINKDIYLDYKKFIFKISPKNIKILLLPNGIYVPQSELKRSCERFMTGSLSVEPERASSFFSGIGRGGSVEGFSDSFSKRFFENSDTFFLDEKIKEYDEKGHISIIFDGIENKITESAYPMDEEKIIIFNNPFNDEWYLMIREYIALQDKFYELNVEINKIILALSKIHSQNIEKNISEMEKNLIISDLLYRKLDGIVRYNIIGLPLAIYSDVYRNEINKVSGLWGMGKDEDEIRNIALKYNQTCANMQKYVASDFTKKKFLNTVRVIKESMDDKEYNELKMSAKLSQDWLNMLNKVKVTNE